MQATARLEMTGDTTLPLPVAAFVSSFNFRRVVCEHGLSLRSIAQTAHVPLMTVWRIWQGYAISPCNATRIRLALHRLTGVPYAFSLYVDEQGQEKGSSV